MARYIGRQHFLSFLFLSHILFAEITYHPCHFKAWTRSGIKPTIYHTRLACWKSNSQRRLDPIELLAHPNLFKLCCWLYYNTDNMFVCLFVCLMVFKTTFNNISVISWRSVLLVEETGEAGENNRPVESHWQTLSHNVVHLELEIRTHNISGDRHWLHR